MRDLSHIGQRFQYEPDRCGICEDVSECGDWLLLMREDVQPSERPRVAVLVEYTQPVEEALT